MAALANAKHEAVAQAYFADPTRIGWKAWKSVYRKVSKHSAETCFSRLLKDVEFSARLDELKEALAAELKAKKVMDLQEVLEQLSNLGRSNMQDFIVGGDSTADVVEDLRSLQREHAAAIQELTIETYVGGAGDDGRDVKRVRLKLHDKKGALSELRRHYEPQKHEHAGKDGGPIETKDVGEMSDLEIARRIAFILARATIAGGAMPPADVKPEKGGA